MTNETHTVHVTDDEVVTFVERYVRDNGLEAGAITPETGLEDAGLDSLATADLLLSARAELVEQGRLDPDATLLDMPLLHTVSDLGDLLRSLGT